MARHKRNGPKSTRAGCLFCKPHKWQGAPLRERQRHSQNRRIEAAHDQVKESFEERNAGQRP